MLHWCLATQTLIVGFRYFQSLERSHFNLVDEKLILFPGIELFYCMAHLEPGKPHFVVHLLKNYPSASHIGKTLAI